MTDREFLTAFETASIQPGTFRHRDHVRWVWCLLQRYPLMETLSRVRSGLLELVTRFGAGDKYHETITVALALLIHERVAAAPERSWQAFEAANADLFHWGNGALLEPYYDPETLASERARRSFVAPGRAGGRDLPEVSA